MENACHMDELLLSSCSQPHLTSLWAPPSGRPLGEICRGVSRTCFPMTRRRYQLAGCLVVCIYYCKRNTFLQKERREFLGILRVLLQEFAVLIYWYGKDGGALFCLLLLGAHEVEELCNLLVSQQEVLKRRTLCYDEHGRSGQLRSDWIKLEHLFITRPWGLINSAFPSIQRSGVDEEQLNNNKEIIYSSSIGAYIPCQLLL